MLTFLESLLIDEYIVSVMPVVLGEGIGLFGRETSPSRLALVNTVSYRTGVVQLHYRAAR